jgi:hypothetical protein
VADREPIGPASRPMGTMPVDMDPLGARPHATHDVVLLAAVADHDPDPATEATVRRMIADCPECATIADELRMLAAGLADLPPSLAAPRDLRLTEGDAARLRRGGLLRRFIRPLGLAGMPGLQPLAGALTALGIAGLLLANIPLGLGSAGAALAPAENRLSGDAVDPGTASGSPEAAGGSADQASSAPAVVTGSSAPGTTPGDIAYGLGPSEHATTPTTPGGVSSITSEADAGPSIPPLTLISIVLVVVGVTLLALRAMARRID